MKNDNQNTTSGFIKYILVIIAVLISATAVFLLYQKNKEREALLNIPPSEVEITKQNILKTVESSSERPLTYDQKEALFEDVAGKKINRYNFSNEQREEILRALNQ